MGRPLRAIGELGPISYDKLPSGAWRGRVRIRGLDGIEHRVTAAAKTKPACTTRLRRRASQLVTADDSPELSENSTVSAAADDWLERMTIDGTRQKSTLQRYRKETASILVKEMGGLRLWEVTTPRAQHVIDRVARQRGVNISRNLRSQGKRLFDHLVALGVVDVNPILATRAPVRPKNEPQAPEIRDIVRLRQAAAWDASPDNGRSGPRSRRLLLAIDIIAGTGARIGEVCALRVGDVDLDAGLVSIHSTIAGGDEGFYVRETRKAGDVGQVVTIPTALVDGLRKVCEDRDAREYVLRTRGGDFVRPYNLRRDLRRVADRADVERIAPRTIRRRVGTEMARAGSGVADAASQLGNTEAVAREHYVVPTHAGPSAAATVLAPLLASVPESRPEDRPAEPSAARKGVET